MLRPALRPAFALFLPLVAAADYPAFAQDAAHGGEALPTSPAGLSDEALQALARFDLRAGLKVALVASEPLLTNPVAFTIDTLGRFYVVETDRVHRGVTDMRGHMDWLEEDLAVRTVEDRVAMYRAHTAPERFEAEYGTAEDRIARLTDEDGDGVLDRRTVFADGFRDPADGIAAGVLTTVRPDGSVEAWFTCIPSLYRLIDSEGDGVADVQEVHSTGYGLRVALLGHDLHGLVVGPDARLYWSIGDRGFNVVTPEGEHLVRLGTGAVFRCDLDGGGLELFCDGLRNPQELVFDDHGNLFTLDNNSDAADQARWTLLLEGSDTGWRQAYQWIEAPHVRGPWDQEGLWRPWHAEQAYWVVPPIANVTNGPSGIVAYPGTGWGDDWNGSFFVCDFRGNPGYSGIWALWNEPDRSGFRLGRTEKPVWDCLPTDVDFGLDGALYWSDWISGWNGPGKGRIFRVEPTERDAAEIERIAEVRALMTADLGQIESAQLSRLLGHADRRVRMRMQLELARRFIEDEDERSAAFAAISEALAAGGASDGFRYRHAAWCAAHVLRRFPAGLSAGQRAGIALEWRAAADPARGEAFHPANLAHFARLLADSFDDTHAPLSKRRTLDALVALAGDVSLDEGTRRRVFEAIGDLRAPAAATFLAGALRGRVANDPWMRHTLVRALEKSGAVDLAATLLGTGETPVRRTAVVMLRRAADARVAVALADEDPGVRAEAAAAIYDAHIEGAMEALARFLGPLTRGTALGADQTLTVRRALHANRAVADARSAARLVAFAAARERPAALRAEALTVLARWGEPETRDGVVRDHRPLPPGDLALVDAGALLGPAFAREVGAIGDGALAEALLGLQRAQRGEDGGSAAPLLELARAAALPERARRRALEAALDAHGEDPDVRAFVARLVAEADAADAGLRPLAFGLLGAEEAARQLRAEANADDAAKRAEAVRVLGRLGTPEAKALMVELAATRPGDDPALVEWLEATGKTQDAALRRARDEFLARVAATPDDPLAPWRMCLEGGDPVLGERIFVGKSETSCTRCHAWNGEGGSEAGPALQGVGARLDRAALLRSILRPNDEIAEGYEQWLLATDDGEIFSGRILEEADGVLALETKDPESGELVVLEFGEDEIANRRRDVSAMPSDLAKHLSRRELRDLVAFLASLQ